MVGERAAAAEVLVDEVRRFAIGLKTDEDAVSHDRPLLRLHAVIVEANVAMRRTRAVGSDVELRRSVFELADVGDLDEARAGVVRLVAGDAIELGRVRDDLVNRQRQVRRHRTILDALADRLGLRVLDGFCRDPFGLAGYIALFRNS